jgi:hypothetical protein
MNKKIKLEAEVIAAIESGKKINAIKQVHALRGLDLKEAKRLVELYISQNYPPDSSSSVSPVLSNSSPVTRIGSNNGLIFLAILGIAVASYFLYQYFS